MGIQGEGFILSARELTLSFGDLVALESVSLDVRQEEILSIIGPNGAGKTCLLNCINGFYSPQHGVVYFEGKEITGFKVHQRARLGIARTFQKIELFGGLSVLENLLAARHVHFRSGPLRTAFFFGSPRREETRHREVVESIIDFLEITRVRKKIVGTLPYGLCKRVELGRALAIEPRILLLDEPLSGMNVEEKEDMARFILDIHDEKGIPIVLIEHDMGVVMDIADRVAVLESGRLVAQGPPAEIGKNERVIHAYLGE